MRQELRLEIYNVPIVRTVTSSNQLALIFSRRDSNSRRRAFPKLGALRSVYHSRTPSDSGPSCQAAWVTKVCTSSRRNEREDDASSLAMFNHCKRGPLRKP